MTMLHIPAGTFRMGSDRFYPEERPIVERTVGAFELDATAVTNHQFAAFVEATGYVTVAERQLDPNDFPGADPADLVPGSLAFTGTSGPVNLDDWRQWWSWVPGATWRHPFGPESDIAAKGEHPVVQVAYEDAVSYATWAGKRLATEEEWEYAARGGLAQATYAWGDDVHPDGRLMANTWQGSFPWSNTGANGHVGTAPVGSFDPNGFGLFDMTGNSWEWTSTRWSPRHEITASTCQCGPGPTAGRPQRVLKGGSHLCAPEYCLRYRPAARSAQDEDSAATHIGFRCARSVAT